MKYEDLAARPAEKFHEVCDFLGLEYSESALDFHYKNEESRQFLKTERSRKHHQSLFKPVSTGRVDLWKKHLSVKEVRIADHVAGNYAKLAGYERRYNTTSAGIRFRSLPGIIYAKLIYLLTGLVDTFPYKTRALILNKGPLALVRIFRKTSKLSNKPNY